MLNQSYVITEFLVTETGVRGVEKVPLVVSCGFELIYLYGLLDELRRLESDPPSSILI